MIFLFKSLFASLECIIFNTYQCLLSIVKVLVLTRPYSKLPIAAEQQCFILGNGPSLNKFLEQHHTYTNATFFCVNHFPSSEAYSKVRPANCVWLDPAFYLYEHPLAEKTIQAIVANTTWQVNLFIPTLGRNKLLAKRLASNSNIKVKYFNYTVIQGFQWFRNFLFRLNLGMPQCQNVLSAAIFLALNSGYKQIFLFGADHSWINDLVVLEDNQLYMKSTHFYTEQSKTQLVVLKDKGGKKRLLTDFLSSATLAFGSYYLLEAYAKARGSRIINATEGSYIDAFERGLPDRSK